MAIAHGNGEPRVRPRDRKQRIEEAAALAFARHGYHPVGMQDIAAAVGISAPALYRHFPNKYALFVRTASTLAHRLIEATDDAAMMPLTSVEEARSALMCLVDETLATTIELRATGGIYRWEGRYLRRPDRDRLTAEFSLLRERFEAAHAVYRPDVIAEDRRVLVFSALSAIASVTAHHTVLPSTTLRSLLSDVAWRVLDGTVATVASAAAAQRRAEHGSVAPRGNEVSGESGETAIPDKARRERLIDAAIEMFAARGYTEATIEDIATKVGLTPSGVYRHFDGKPSLLLAACDRATIDLERAMLFARETSASSDDALRRLCRAYVDHTFANRPLMRVYFSEVGNLAPEQQRALRAVQRAHVADWAALLQSVRPELGGREATVLVHAGLGIVTDRAPLLVDLDEAAALRLTRLVEIALGIAEGAVSQRPGL